MFSEKRQAYFGVMAACVTLLICMGVIVTGQPTGQDKQVALPGASAPDLASTDLDNQWVNLSGFRGSYVLVYFAPDLSGVTSPTSRPSLLQPDQQQVNAAERISSTIATENADLPRLASLSKRLHAAQVTVLEVPRDVGTASMNLISLVAQSDGEMHHTTRMVLDTDGDIARKFRVDRVAMEPTLFVIDGAGVIRYRGSCAQASAEKLLQDQPGSTPPSASATFDGQAGQQARVDESTVAASRPF